MASIRPIRNEGSNGNDHAHNEDRVRDAEDGRHEEVFREEASHAAVFPAQDDLVFQVCFHCQVCFPEVLHPVL